jgi:hypothetical protein
MAVAQTAYDTLADRGGDGTFQFAPGTWTVDRPFHHYQHRTVVTAPGAVFKPAPGFDGFVFDVRPAGETNHDYEPGEPFLDRTFEKTVTGPSGQPEHMGLANIAIDGEDRCKGIRLADLKHSWFENLFVVKARGGPGMELAGSVRESVVRNLQLFLSGGTGTDAALKIEPDPALDPFWDATNQVYFFGGFVGLSNDRAIWMHTNSYPANTIRHVKCSHFQVHAQNPAGIKGYEPPKSSNITLAGIQQSSFVNSNLRGCGPDEAVINLTASPDTGAPTENALVLGCDFSGPQDNATGLSLGRGTVRTRLIGNTFGHHGSDNIPHAIDWGAGGYSIVASANSFDTGAQAFLGVPPNNEAGASIVGTDAIDLGMAETWHDGRLNRRLTGTRTIQQGNRKTVPQGHDWRVAAGTPEVNAGSLLLAAVGDTDQAIVGPGTPFYVSAGTVSIDAQWQGTPASGGFTLEFFAGESGHWQLRWRHDDTLALEKSTDDDGPKPVITTSLAIDEDWHTIGAMRTPDGTWTLLTDGNAVGSESDEFMPVIDGAPDTMAIASTADAQLRCRDVLVY